MSRISCDHLLLSVYSWRDNLILLSTAVEAFKRRQILVILVKLVFVALVICQRFALGKLASQANATYLHPRTPHHPRHPDSHLLRLCRPRDHGALARRAARHPCPGSARQAERDGDDDVGDYAYADNGDRRDYVYDVHL